MNVQQDTSLFNASRKYEFLGESVKYRGMTNIDGISYVKYLRSSGENKVIKKSLWLKNVRKVG